MASFIKLPETGLLLLINLDTMITVNKKSRYAALAAAAVVTLLAVLNFSAGAEKKAAPKKLTGVKSIAQVIQLSKENTTAQITARGIYAGGNTAAAILLKSPPAENETALGISCFFEPDISADISAVPLLSEFVISGNIEIQNGKPVLTHCKLLTVNLPVAASAQ